MPTFIDNNGREIPFASADEVLEFCQKVRRAGGGDALEALLPSVPNDSQSCLIANNLNFACQVDASDKSLLHPGESLWEMNLSNWNAAYKIARELDLELLNPGREETSEAAILRLPRLIGNAASAFDAGVSEFADYVDNSNPYDHDDDAGLL